MKTKLSFILVSVILFLIIADAQKSIKMTEKPKAKIKYISEDFDISDLDNKVWNETASVKTKRYWSGMKAPKGRRFKTKLLWSNTALYVRFIANQREELVVSEDPVLTEKTLGLWDRDVCEIFLAPNKAEFRKYFEFEVAPTGEWIDLGIRQLVDKRELNWDYKSGMLTAAEIRKNKVVMAIEIEWKALGKMPKVGDIWMGNILRAVGTDPNRGYLAWSPTLSETPNFHLPEKFGEFEFVK